MGELIFKKIKATFIGKDGSLGFRNGIEYDLLIKDASFGKIYIKLPDAPMDCVYNGTIPFLNNWTKIKTT